jgi:hypothetical protein
MQVLTEMQSSVLRENTAKVYLAVGLGLTFMDHHLYSLSVALMKSLLSFLVGVIHLKIYSLNLVSSMFSLNESVMFRIEKLPDGKISQFGLLFLELLMLVTFEM